MVAVFGPMQRKTKGQLFIFRFQSNPKKKKNRIKFLLHDNINQTNNYYDLIVSWVMI